MKEKPLKLMKSRQVPNKPILNVIQIAEQKPMHYTSNLHVRHLSAPQIKLEIHHNSQIQDLTNLDSFHPN